MGPLIPLFWTSGDVSSGFKSQSGQPYSCLVEAYMLHFPEIHLWCNTCWPLGSLSQHGSWASRHWWGSKPGSIVPPLRDKFQTWEFSPIKCNCLRLSQRSMEPWMNSDLNRKLCIPKQYRTGLLGTNQQRFYGWHYPKLNLISNVEDRTTNI